MPLEAMRTGLLITTCNGGAVVLRPAVPEDAEALLEIYAPYVRETAVTFEYDVPSLEEFRGRIERTLERYPYLVAEADGEAVGYAYAGPLKGRAAYDWSVETTIYLRRDRRRRGVGRRLYLALEEILRAQNILNLYACIARPELEDQYLTRDSEAFHTRMGYRLIGEFRKCGYKFGTWYNMVWMEKFLGEHPEKTEAFLPFSELSPEIVKTICNQIYI